MDDEPCATCGQPTCACLPVVTRSELLERIRSLLEHQVGRAEPNADDSVHTSPERVLKTEEDFLRMWRGTPVLRDAPPEDPYASRLRERERVLRAAFSDPTHPDYKRLGEIMADHIRSKIGRPMIVTPSTTGEEDASQSNAGESGTDGDG